MRTVDIAWAAGFFDGEGCVRFRNNKCQFIKWSQKEVEALSRLKRLFGIGSIRKSTSANRSTYLHEYFLFGRDAVIVLALMLPYLTVKREKAIEALRTGETIRHKARNAKMIQTKTRHPNHRWTLEELQELVVLRNKGVTFKAIGNLFNMTGQRVHQLYWSMQNATQLL